MNIAEIVFSPTGGTQRVADIIGEALKGRIRKVDLSDPKEDFDRVSLENEDLSLIAVPSFGGRVPALATERLEKIRGNNVPCVIVCVYGNRAYEDTLIELEDSAKKCGFKVIAGVAAIAEHSIMHQYATGRPDGQDRGQLEDFAGKILEKLDKEDFSTPAIPGNRPYKKAGGGAMVPKADSKCNFCGTCAESCPAEAISIENPKETDSKKCISCMRCIAVCPQSARKLNSALVAAAALAMKKVCSVRKDNELFI